MLLDTIPLRILHDMLITFCSLCTTPHTFFEEQAHILIVDSADSSRFIRRNIDTPRSQIRLCISIRLSLRRTNQPTHTNYDAIF